MNYEFLNITDLPTINELPNPFIDYSGKEITTVNQWKDQREYLKQMLAHYLYGHMPVDSGQTKGNVIFSRLVYSGKAIAETVQITCGPIGEIHFNVDIIRPYVKKKIPVFIFNQPKGRHGSPIEEEIVCQHEYAIAEFDREQLAPDGPEAKECCLAKTWPKCDWGVIAMWAWGHSRIADYLLTTDWCDTSKMIVTGHSRGGKAALCAAIYDERIAICAPNGSGCGGCGCFRYLGSRYGEGIGLCETAGSIFAMAPYWWSKNFAYFGAQNPALSKLSIKELNTSMSNQNMQVIFDNLGITAQENKLPFDMHTARALIAPRAIISTDALGDMWSNTYGTQINWLAAQEVFDFLNVPNNNAIHFREGSHDFQSLDWQVIINYCDMLFYGEESKNIQYFNSLPNSANIEEKMQFQLDFKSIRHLHYSWSNPHMNSI